jgi:PTS system mannose-specific IIC component
VVRHHRFFFALFSLFRISVSLGLVERPLVIGLLWGLCSGNLETSLYSAIFYELLWLDFIPVGTFIPPHMTAATFAGLAISSYFGLTSPPFVFLALVAGLPMAWLGARMDRVLRDRLNRSYGLMLQWLRKPHDVDMPSRMLLGVLASKLLMSWVFFMAGTGVLAVCVRFVLNHYSGQLAGLKLSWSHFLIAASLGGLLALRLRSMYLAVGAGALALGIFHAIGIF